MPAVRNFSLAAAAAVVLDFVLQVGWGHEGGREGPQRGTKGARDVMRVCGLR